MIASAPSGACHNCGSRLNVIERRVGELMQSECDRCTGRRWDAADLLREIDALLSKYDTMNIDGLALYGDLLAIRYPAHSLTPSEETQ